MAASAQGSRGAEATGRGGDGRCQTRAVRRAAPEAFDVARPETWPRVTGRLEYAGGRLEYMPPCGKNQQRVVASEATTEVADRIPEAASMPGLSPNVAELFRQI
jgi:hypothetical protein